MIKLNANGTRPISHKVRAVGGGRKAWCITDGKAADTLTAELTAIGQEALLARSPSIKELLPEQVAAGLNALGITLNQLFQQAGVPYAQLREADAQVLSTLASYDDRELEAVQSLIYGLQAPWWKDKESTLSKSTDGERSKYLAQMRTGSTKRNIWRVGQYPNSQNILEEYYMKKSSDPSRIDKIIRFKTDHIPTFCWELHAPYSFFIKGNNVVPFYTNNLTADGIFCEYLLMAESLQPIIAAYLRAREEAKK